MTRSDRGSFVIDIEQRADVPRSVKDTNHLNSVVDDAVEDEGPLKAGDPPSTEVNEPAALTGVGAPKEGRRKQFFKRALSRFQEANSQRRIAHGIVRGLFRKVGPGARRTVNDALHLRLRLAASS